MENLPANVGHEVSHAGNPFGRMVAHTGGMNVGAVAIEQERAIAEAQGKLVLAKRFPRDTALARREMADACKDMALAEVAFYALPRGDETIEGPTIKLAEELARCWGNIDYGHRELSRSDGKSEIEVYAWDTQTNTTSTRQLTVRHTIDLSGGRSRATKSEKEIDDLVARKASAQLRGRILAVLPKSLVQTAIMACRQTLKGGNGEPLSARIDKMVAAFAKIGVTGDMLVKKLGHPLDQTTADELVDMIGVFTSIREGHFTVEDQFPVEDAEQEGDPEKSGAQQVVKQQQAAAAKGQKEDSAKSTGKAAGRQKAQAAEPAAPAEPSQPKAAPEQSEGTPAKEPEKVEHVQADQEGTNSGNNDEDVF